MAEDESLLGGHASERAAHMILGEGLKGNLLLGGDHGKLALVHGEEAFTGGVVDLGHGSAKGDCVVEVGLAEAA